MRSGRRDGSGAAGGLADLWRYRGLVWQLVLQDLRLKYRNSALGLAWSLLHPLLMLVVYTFAFRVVLRVPTENYAYFVLTGFLPWGFFTGALLASTQAITGNGSLLRAVPFPPEVLPIASVLFAFAQFLAAFGVFVPALALASGGGFHWTAALIVPVVALHLLFTTGLAMVLAATTVFFRDVRHLTEVGLLLLFWLTPVVYPVTMVPDAVRPYVHLNPAAAFVVAYQDALFWGRPPEAIAVVVMVSVSLLALAGGQTCFRRLRPRLAEEV